MPLEEEMVAFGVVPEVTVIVIDAQAGYVLWQSSKGFT
jgi:hypothetical protein